MRVTEARPSPKRRRVRPSAFALPLLLAACQGETPPDLNQAAAGPPPPVVCEEVRKALKPLEGQMSIEFDDKGEATVEQGVWLTMPPENRAEFARSLAFHAACASGRQSEAQQVRIRNEMGTMLLETTISTKVDLRSVLGKGQN
jgi:hypothetical protein